MAQLRRFGGWLLLLVAALTAVQPLLGGGAPARGWGEGPILGIELGAPATGEFTH